MGYKVQILIAGVSKNLQEQTGTIHKIIDQVLQKYKIYNKIANRN